jgi:MerC mercury resistance protein
MQKKSLADKLGIFFSSLCALHCLILPILIFNSGHFLAKYINNQFVEKGFIIICLSIAAFSFFRFKKSHGNSLPILLLVIAVLFLVGSTFFDSVTFEIISSVIGSSALIFGHIINMRQSRYC